MPRRPAAARSTAWRASHREGADRDRLEETFVANLSYAAKKLARRAASGCSTEPINTRDIPGFFLTTRGRRWRSSNASGRTTSTFNTTSTTCRSWRGISPGPSRLNLDRIAHVQLADNPGRHEPGTGEINYPFLFAHLDRLGYKGWVGAEYKPLSGTEAGLGWLRAAEGQGSAAA